MRRRSRSRGARVGGQEVKMSEHRAHYPCMSNWSFSRASKRRREAGGKPSWEEENSRVILVLDLSLITCKIAKCWCPQENIFRLCFLGNKMRRRCPRVEKGLKVIWSLWSSTIEGWERCQHKREWGSLITLGRLKKIIICNRKGSSL